MLKEHGFEATYREYTKEPLSRSELVSLLKTLKMVPRDVLRAADAKKAELAATATDDEVLDAMAANNRLLQRPILITPKGAAVGRPVENLLAVMG